MCSDSCIHTSSQRTGAAKNRIRVRKPGQPVGVHVVEVVTDPLEAVVLHRPGVERVARSSPLVAIGMRTSVAAARRLLPAARQRSAPTRR